MVYFNFDIKSREFLIYQPNILVTGASGFVGRSLCEKLLTKDYKVRVLTRSDNTKIKCSEHKIIHSFDNVNELSNAVQNVDVVIHLAARVHVLNDASINPLFEFNKVNLYGTENLAKAAAFSGVKRFVYLSSIKVNGEHTELLPFNANSLPHAEDAYAQSKLNAENILLSISQQTGMELVVVRPPLVYGPGVKANFLNLLKLVNTGIPLPLAAINNKRSLIYLGNLVDALIQCAVHPAAAGNTYLVSDGQDVSTPELIRHIADSLQTPARLLNVPLTLISFIAKLLGKSSSVERLTQSLVIDSSKIRNELGWSPPFTLEQGLAATAAWFKENH